MRICTISALPSSTASCRGVLPPKPSAALTSAPASTRSLTVSTSPFLMAVKSASLPIAGDCLSSPSGVPLSAPCPSRICMISVAPSSAARPRGVRPMNPSASMSAPASTRICTISALPFSTASCKGVLPPKPSAALTSAPASTISLTITALSDPMAVKSALPPIADGDGAFLLSPLAAVAKSGARPSRTFMISVAPSSAARLRGV